MKRSREDNDEGARPKKVLRSIADGHGERDDRDGPVSHTDLIPDRDRLSDLSDELLVKVLSYASPRTLLSCQRVSQKFARLSVDSELWKDAFYRRFVKPRVARIPALRTINASPMIARPKFAKWLDEQNLVGDGAGTNWKQQYRLRHNW
jgi:hypothetical protein